MIERRIKELSIALEALSRVNNYNAMRLFDDVTEQLRTLVDQNKPKLEPADMGEKAAAESYEAMKSSAVRKVIDEEIPF